MQCLVGSARLFVTLLVISATNVAIASAPWTTGSDTPLLSESRDAAKFDSDYIAGPKVVYDADTSKYFMYYTGGLDEEQLNRESIGLATASSVDGPWEKYNSPNYRDALFAPGAIGSFYYSRNWGSGTVLKTGANSWKMWTVGSSTPDIRPHSARVGFATSGDGYHWTMYQGQGFGGSVFEDFSVNASGVGSFAVLVDGNAYHAWYSSLYSDIVRHATSTDGINWVIQEQSPRGLGGAYTIDNVVKLGDAYLMTASRPNLDGVDIYTSSNLLDWTMLHDRSFVPSSSGWDSTRIYQAILYPATTNEWRLFYTGANVADDRPQSKIGVARLTIPEPSQLLLLSVALLVVQAWRPNVRFGDAHQYDQPF